MTQQGANAMIGSRILLSAAALLFAACAAVAPSLGENGGPAAPFQAHVDMKTFMEHVLTPAAKVVWSVNGVVIDEKGEHDLSPKTDDDWEQIVSGAASTRCRLVEVCQTTRRRRRQSLSSRRSPRPENDIGRQR
jgi:hypothetical protein